MTTAPDPHDLENGGHEPIDIDPQVPTGLCRICTPEPVLDSEPLEETAS